MSSLSGTLKDRRILLGVTGSIAAYKAPFIYRELTAHGAQVRVVLTEAAQRFVGKAVFSGLGAEAFADMWDGPSEPHVELASWADCLLVAPTTADFVAQLRLGRASDLLTAAALCFKGPLFLAPAMHPAMWSHPASAENVAVLRGRGAHILGPIEGQVASGDHGMGRMMAPERIVSLLSEELLGSKQTLSGRHVVVTAGPTREPIDPVRAITNVSSGKMGYAIARAAQNRGARVTLISGPVSLAPPDGVALVRIESTQQLQSALADAMGPDLQDADVLIMAAAVSDYRPAHPAEQKIKRGDQGLQLQLVPNPDLLAAIGKRRTGLRPVLVGFALETQSEDALAQLGRKKLVEKKADLIVANLAVESLGKDENKVRLVSAEDCLALEKMSKTAVGEHIVDWVQNRLSDSGGGSGS